jgi:tRNA threonylcarbamoyladenosine biosynthesis protein TsaB
LRLVDVVCAQAGYVLADVTMFAVNVGPGAFTGIRVGLATAQGLALAYNKPVIGCNAFEALVALVPQWQGLVCPVINARRGEVYAALYRQDGEQVHEECAGIVVTPEALCALVRERTLFLGSGVGVYGEVFATCLGERAVCVNTHAAERGLAAAVARVGARRFPMTETELLCTLQPLYVRPADARMPRVAANAAIGLREQDTLQAPA